MIMEIGGSWVLLGHERACLFNSWMLCCRASSIRRGRLHDTLGASDGCRPSSGPQPNTGQPRGCCWQSGCQLVIRRVTSISDGDGTLTEDRHPRDEMCNNAHSGARSVRWAAPHPRRARRQHRCSTGRTSCCARSVCLDLDPKQVFEASPGHVRFFSSLARSLSSRIRPSSEQPDDVPNEPWGRT